MLSVLECVRSVPSVGAAKRSTTAGNKLSPDVRGLAWPLCHQMTIGLFFSRYRF